jgi:hypothetical protein
MGTDKPLDEAQLAQKMTAMPKVEERKRMAAEYKASSIASGKFEDDRSVAAVARHLRVMSLQKERHTSVGSSGDSRDL